MSRLHGLEVLVVHAKPRLSPWSRLLLVERVAAGRPAAHVAAEMGVSRATAYKWLARYRAEGTSGLLDRSSRPRSCPTRTDPVVEAAIVALRRDRRLGPARIASVLGLNPSTVHRVLVRHAMARLSWLDRPTGQVIRRYERARPGELVHVDVKKLGAIRPGGGLAGARQAVRAAPGHSSRTRRRPAGRLRLRALRHRRPHPAGLRRDPPRRERRDLRRVSVGGRVVGHYPLD